MASEFEKRYLIKSQYWVNSIAIDALNSTIEIELIANPEIQNIDRKLRFEEIIEYQGQYHEFDNFGSSDPNYLPILLGIFSVNTEKETRYTITTDTIEIILITKKEPIILWMD